MPLRKLTNVTNSNLGDNSEELDDEIIKQFKLIISIVFIVLILSLIYFVYNLIKCYLPKWRKAKLQEDELKSAKIISEPKKEYNKEIELF